MKSFSERTAKSARSNTAETSKNAASASSVPIQMIMPEPEKDLVAQNKSVAQKAVIDEEQEPILKKAFQLQSDTAQLADMDDEEPVLKKPFQLKSDTTQLAESEEEEPILKKPFQLKSDSVQLAGDEEEPILKKQSGADTAALQMKSNNTGMPDNLKAGVEGLSGFSMDDVKVHYNSPKPASLQAYAYAQGTDIHVGPGQEKHLAHEAWHVVQQKQGRVQPTMQMKEGVPVNDDRGLEHEADVMGAKAVSFKTPTANSTPIQRLCKECQHEEGLVNKTIQGKRVAQLYEECEESNHHAEPMHAWLQRRYKKHFGRGSREYSFTIDGSWNFVDIADEDDKEVYEIKSDRQGAGTATAEAKAYVKMLNGPQGCEGKWKLGRSFDKVWQSEGAGIRRRGWSPQDGAILYSTEEIDLTSSSEDSGSESSGPEPMSEGD